MVVRKMEEKDINKVCIIEQQNFSHPWKFRDFLNSCTNDENLYLVAAEKDEVVGYCGLWGVSGEGQINNVSVQDTYQNRGIGYMMLSGLIKEGMRMGLEAFTLEARVSNTAAIKLYHKLGFQDAGIRKGFYDSPKEDAVIMWLYQGLN